MGCRGASCPPSFSLFPKRSVGSALDKPDRQPPLWLDFSEEDAESRRERWFGIFICHQVRARTRESEQVIGTIDREPYDWSPRTRKALYQLALSAIKIGINRYDDNRA